MRIAYQCARAAALLAAASALGAMHSAWSENTIPGARDNGTELPPIIVRPDADDLLYESDRQLRAIIRSLPDGEPPGDLHFGIWLLHSLGLAGGPTVQNAHSADQVRAKELLDRLEAPTPR